MDTDREATLMDTKRVAIVWTPIRGASSDTARRDTLSSQRELFRTLRGTLYTIGPEENNLGAEI